MQETLAIKDQLLATFGRLVTGIIEVTPKIIIGILLLLVALVVAKVIEKILQVGLKRLRFDSLLARPGIDQSLQRMGLRQPMSQVIPRLIYFLLLFLFARAAADALGLDAVSQAIGSFLSYVPNLVAGILILLLGSVGGQFAGKTVAQASESAGIEYGSTLGRLVSALVMFVAAIMALGQLQIETDIIGVVTTCFLAGLALAFALSFGLGSRDISRNIIAGFYARKVFELGEEMEIAGERGVLRAITPTQTLLERDGRTIAISNGVFLEQVVKQ
ncbi:MAG: hypothetical protein WBP34_10415 [Thermoanaerobaculia bacterium]